MDKDKKMKELNCQEIEEVSGGFWVLAIRLALPTLINMATYAFKKHHRHEEITPQGLAIAGSAGLVAGSLGVGGGLAAGGGLIGNAVWAPSSIATNVSGNLIAEKY